MEDVKQLDKTHYFYIIASDMLQKNENNIIRILTDVEKRLNILQKKFNATKNHNIEQN